MKGWVAARRHGAFASTLRALLLHPLARDLDLDSPEATAVHASLIRDKAFLHRLYLRYYAEIESAVGRSTAVGPVVEVGSGGGFYREIRPAVVSLDLRQGADVDVRGSAVDLPFRTGSVRAIVMLDALHHVPLPARLLRECVRVLGLGGRVCMVEPFASALSRRLIRPLHHEPWDEQSGWELPALGPMSGANMALPTAIFVRDRARYDREFPELPIDRIRFHTVLTYLVSGGVSMRSLAPGFLFGPLWAMESALGSTLRSLGSMMTVELVRRQR